MAVSSAQVSVTTTATALNTADPDSYVRIRVAVPAGGQTVFLGGSAVTTTTGLGVLTGTHIDIDLVPGDVLYGIVAATTQTTHVLRVTN